MIDPGEGYRLLEKGEVIQEGDEYAFSTTPSKWYLKTTGATSGAAVMMVFALKSVKSTEVM